MSSIYGLGDPRQYLKMMLHVSRGERIDQRAILRRLAELQYKRNDMELKRGTYRVRGELIDIFPAESDDEALRIELFDDEIEALSLFDPLTGEVLPGLTALALGVVGTGLVHQQNLPGPASRRASSGRSGARLRSDRGSRPRSKSASVPLSTW